MARATKVEYSVPETTDLSSIVDRVLVFDNLLSDTQILLLERWAFQTPHWMLTNSVYDEHGEIQHRIWGASYIKAWQTRGWPGLPPVLFSTAATIFQKLGFIFTEPKYIGLNGQSRGQDASTHVDCERDTPDQLSVLIYIGEDTNGDLLLYDKDSPTQVIQNITFRPNRVVAFDGSIPHSACAPSDSKFRVSAVIRGVYECRHCTSSGIWLAARQERNSGTVTTATE